MTGNDVAQSGGNTAVHDRSDAFLFCQTLQLKHILAKEGNINHVLPGLNDLLQDLEAHKTRDGADHQVKILGQFLDGAFFRQICLISGHTWSAT